MQHYCRKSPSFTANHKLIMSQEYHMVAKWVNSIVVYLSKTSVSEPDEETSVCAW